ncbi:2-oxoglutarate dehydrogenase E1 component [candidate division BRC1 bacterium HGW-BRC1-1]|jgi:2-oxoglutarate dehydrogenase E1 component|nr:MAG: 2-oxoglutarate dehydrogenase E1 component [candidate division BRC1 bacterium HGW-BRC1-1]
MVDKMKTSPAFTMNAEYLDQFYQAWLADPASVPADLAHFFEGFELGHSQSGGGIQRKHLQSAVNSLVYHYRSVGHRIAQINPLGGNPHHYPELDLAAYNLSESNLTETFDSNHIPGMAQATLGEIIAHMRETYCGPIGVEYMHIQATAERRWLQERMETSRNRPDLSRDQRRRALFQVAKAEVFEHFLHSNYRGQKRFSLEGAETTIAAMDFLVERAQELGVREIVIGMAHRGRLNVLANIIKKSFTNIFSEFEDNYLQEAYFGDGDVKYHKGFSNDVVTAEGHPMHLSLTPNPSHLEIVGPVVQGKVRAKQAERRDAEHVMVLPFIMHGDAAFAGQGIVAETFNLSQLKGYRTGGTIHFIINNQVGFTTGPLDYQSGMYCTDMAKIIDVPIFHVNGDAPESVLHVMDIALAYRQRFKKDVVIDMWCYRRHGHNEADEPAFTQPLLYEKINAIPSVPKLYGKKLADDGVMSASELAEMEGSFEASLNQAKAEAASPRQPKDVTIMRGRWKGLQRYYSHEPVETGVPLERLKQIANHIAHGTPDGFNIHRKIQKLFNDFAAAVEAGEALTWANAEALAFGSLLLDKIGVRLSGEDSRRGTFSQRHAAVYDQKTGDMFIPLTTLTRDQGDFCVYDSSLAEASVLAFDLGYSMADPYRLIMWEAQFGDFANGAQVIIDQFMASGLSKWNRHSGLVMLLPHGYEGQGPEHSNGWLRRYLSLCAEDNIQVIYPSTPAQYFHALRRQVLRNFRRPLIIMTPKSMLRDPRATSTAAELEHGSFRELIDDARDIPTPRRVLFVAGKLYHELMTAVAEQNAHDVAVVRVEQLYPINEEAWQAIGDKYGHVAEWAWMSEEPTNFGAWGFMKAVMAPYHHGDTWVIGRARSASPATGSLTRHKAQQKMLLDLALKPGKLESSLQEGVVVFTQGEVLWHLKSKSHHSANPSTKAPSPNG